MILSYVQILLICLSVPRQRPAAGQLERSAFTTMPTEVRFVLLSTLLDIFFHVGHVGPCYNSGTFFIAKSKWTLFYVDNCQTLFMIIYPCQ